MTATDLILLLSSMLGNATSM